MSKKIVRHKPGYTPEGAAARRMMREMARRLGVPPRRLKRKFSVGYSASALYFKFTKDFGERYLASKPANLPSFLDSALGEPFDPDRGETELD